MNSFGTELRNFSDKWSFTVLQKALLGVISAHYWCASPALAVTGLQRI